MIWVQANRWVAEVTGNNVDVNDLKSSAKTGGQQLDVMTWTALLGYWVQIARGALFLPDDMPGQRLRESVPDIIMLQAVWFALGRLDDLDGGERDLGMDRAAVLIDRHRDALNQRFSDTPMPEILRQLVQDVVSQLEACRAG